ncbi:MAG: hormogonium polysaccharide biosynthesis protein HpsA [Coleofasciculus chthonoplastes F3-SA18-01]|uniref:hormogonium polysaccharide biosynthesis protein HpsA n=1 Tax=Coleofasciculus chthonoplastes TaxID=64178 RepID=UPI0032FB6910
MSTTQKLIKSAQRLLRNVLQLGKHLTKQVMNWLLRNLFVLRRHPNSPQAGFVLPTVIMVMLVVTLLTTAILFRSFDRAKNASNVRINQATLSAATPALDRAKAKVEKLLNDPNLPRGTPSDSSIASVIEAINDEYKFNDETRLEITDGSGTANTAWRFPVDTDNNGKYDSFTVYSILYKTPTDPDAERTSLQARTGPMTNVNTNEACAAAEGTTASLVGSGGWVLVKGILKKSIFVYVATVPITDLDEVKGTIPTTDQNQYEPYQKGNKGFSALELQVDVPKVPLSNNAVVYEDDLEIFAGSPFSLNGRVMTNSNLFLYKNADLKLRLVSSPASCFYEEENSKIVVGGNVAYGYIANADTSGDVNIDLFQGRNEPPTKDQLFSTTNQSVTGTPATIGYNTLAYEKRIAKFVENAKGTTPLPDEVEEDMNDKGLSEAEALDRYFRKRVRRVPYAEVGYGATDNKIGLTTVTGDGNKLRPGNDRLVYPFKNDGLNSDPAGNAFLALKENGDLLYPGATEFEEQERLGKENLLGDRVLVGNNLPELRYEGDEWVGKETPQDIKKNASTPYKWNAPAGETSPRQRKTRVETLADAGDISRDGFWERASLDPDPEVFTGQPKDELDPTGGLRVVTGAGIYLPDDDVTDQSNVVWPDSMPAIGPWASGSTPWGSAFPTDTAGEKRPYLKMRATAVYHYRYEKGKKPVACVATYYDPTNRLTANNNNPFIAGLSRPEANVSGEMIADYDPDDSGSQQPRRPTGSDGASSVNGITFGPPDSKDLSSYLTYLSNQVYPNGRPVNPILKEALSLAEADRDIHHQAAIDAARCGLNIYGKISAQTGDFGEPAGLNPNYPLPNGTIKETAFLDARQIKAIDGAYDQNTQTTSYTLDGEYKLPIAQRYPLEIRATVIDLDQLRQKTAGSTTSPQEYMLPNSGIIYATRNDALPDDSDRNVADTTTINDINPDRVSSTDFRLDPTRRPNGIMLVNGAKLFRDRNNYRVVEKGLIVASNLPVYIKAQTSSDTTLEGFNPHQDKNAEPQEEFDTPVTDANFYTRSNLNTSFACRIGDPRLPDTSCTDTNADEWRPAAVISDAVTLLSSTFREGFRNEGDYDLRNNQIDNRLYDSSLAVDPATGSGSIEQKRLENGFWNNNFVTNGLSSNLDGIPNEAAFGKAKTDQDYSTAGGNPRNSSYFNNMVTPVQRRVRFSEYVMEICRKLPVSDCQPNDWVINVEGQGDVPVWNVPLETPVADINTGTTDKAPESPEDQRYSRRVAFLRNPSNGHLITTGAAPNLKPIPLGISTAGVVNYYPHTTTTLTITDKKFNPSGTATSFPAFDTGIPSGRPRLSDNALWYGTEASTATRPGQRNSPLSYQNKITGTTPKEHPLLRPALQLQNTTNVESGGAINNAGTVNWLPRAKKATKPVNATIFNLIMATGDTPSRPATSTHEGDIGGALSVLPRFLENWANDSQTIQISGSFIQTKRSAYATAPFYQLPNKTNTAGLFSDIQAYKTGNDQKAPFYEAASRAWGFDVGLLSQLPDLFAQNFAVSPDEEPNLFFREVSRNDPWIKPLLCAQTVDGDFALPESERPSCS